MVQGMQGVTRSSVTGLISYSLTRISAQTLKFNKSMKLKRCNLDPRGFALTATLSLMILLTVIAVVLLAHSSISLRPSGQSSAMSSRGPTPKPFCWGFPNPCRPSGRCQARH